jgi:hypothetical protein
MNQRRYSYQTPILPQIHINRVLVFGSLILMALLAFEIFNFSTTEFALRDLIGGPRFAGLPWATILAIAFCGIDFAGLARMFTPQTGADEPREVWYLFGAWMLAAIMNALLTWWGVSIAIYSHDTLGNGIIARRTLLQVVPIFVAIMVWLIRVLIIGTFSVAGDRLFNAQGKRREFYSQSGAPAWQPQTRNQPARSLARQPVNTTVPVRYSGSGARPAISHNPVQPVMSTVYNPAPRTTQETPPEAETGSSAGSEYESSYHTADPVYVPVGLRSRTHGGQNQARK